jgi:hypothetical protein
MFIVAKKRPPLSRDAPFFLFPFSRETRGGKPINPPEATQQENYGGGFAQYV